MAATNPSYYQSGVCQDIRQKEHRFHLYMFQKLEGTTHANQKVVVNPGLPMLFGVIAAQDWVIRDGSAADANLVARARGMQLGSGKADQNWLMCYSISFTDTRFKGSSLKVLGDFAVGGDDLGQDGEWAIVGGTGEFAYANGVVIAKEIGDWRRNDGRTWELRISVLCPCISKAKPVQKIGPWGGNGGTVYELQDAELPQRLESLTIYAEDFIESIAFSYIDQAGQKRTVGPWGGDDGKSKLPAIQFGSSETVTEIYGATGKYNGANTVVTSLTIVTNVTSYGPYGKQSMGNTPFHVAPPNNHSIVGFYGRVGKVVDQIGAYVSPN
ncbi:mannose/glucose-specific lectin-like [Panicum miliaceum]|uniref:Dirigent protein n=1 Tax=Panicum miliaceum TaxID=4540 RepID=A0A3L6TAW9_PANMI|nr:mannose/glucose-specific lectin-like [Panicum miliaceum]